MKLKDLILDPSVLDNLLTELDSIASSFSSSEYGLPLYDEGNRALLRQCLLRFLAQSCDF